MNSQTSAPIDITKASVYAAVFGCILEDKIEKLCQIVPRHETPALEIASFFMDGFVSEKNTESFGERVAKAALVCLDLSLRIDKIFELKQANLKVGGLRLLPLSPDFLSVLTSPRASGLIQSMVSEKHHHKPLSFTFKCFPEDYSDLKKLDALVDFVLERAVPATSAMSSWRRHRPSSKLSTPPAVNLEYDKVRTTAHFLEFAVVSGCLPFSSDSVSESVESINKMWRPQSGADFTTSSELEKNLYELLVVGPHVRRGEPDRAVLNHYRELEKSLVRPNLFAQIDEMLMQDKINKLSAAKTSLNEKLQARRKQSTSALDLSGSYFGVNRSDFDHDAFDNETETSSLASKPKM